MNETVIVVQFKQTVDANIEVEEDMLQEVVCSKLGLPEGVAKSKKNVVGLYTARKIYPNENLIRENFKEEKELEDQFMYEMNQDQHEDPEEQTGFVSLTVPSLAAGLSGKLEPGDIISIVCYIDDKQSTQTGSFTNFQDGSTSTEIYSPEKENVKLYDELKYVEVKAVTNQKAKNIDQVKEIDEKDRTSSDTIIPATIMVECIDDQQMLKLVQAENEGRIHVIFRVRGENKEELLDEQKSIIDKLKGQKVQELEKDSTKQDEVSQDKGDSAEIAIE